MAVGYQYQNDYDKKEDKKGSKKKLIILGVGLLSLVIIAILGMPNQEQQVTQTETINNRTELDVAQGLSLNESQKAVKLNTDGFLLTVKNNGDYKDFTAPLVYSALQDKPSLLDQIISRDINSCILQSVDDSNNSLSSVSTYGCSGFYVMLATSNTTDAKTSNKVISWRIMNAN